MNRVALAVLLLLLIAATPSETPPAVHLAQGKPEAQAADPQKYAEPSQVTSRLPDGEEIHAEKTGDARENVTQNIYCKDGGAAAPSSWSTIFTLFVALFTGALVLMSYCQWRAMRKSNRINRQNLHLAYRPWVVTDEMGIDEAAAHPFAIKIRFKLVNCGATPAVRLKLKLGWNLAGRPQVDLRTSPVYVEGKVLEHEMGVIGSKMSLEIADELPLLELAEPPLAEIIAPEGEAFNLFVSRLREAGLSIFGRIEYWGSFKRRDPYVTTFFYVKDKSPNAFWMMGPYNQAT
jgi:hypothetical protein